MKIYQLNETFQYSVADTCVSSGHFVLTVSISYFPTIPTTQEHLLVRKGVVPISK